ncbi:hypothetical protein PUN28_001035 [Cardiocondyla obscurior]|uniref:Uncharacterized protein n=1 Tax=Cardiocondyla obscurior TaxID=286306 RepID=A0AAW2H2J5_9HYME
MGTTGGARNVARAHPLAVAIPSEQGVLPINHDSSASLRFILPFCPAYDFCKESKRPCSSPVLDRDPQITTLHNLLQAMKEAALKLIQLITIDIEERRKRDANPWTHNPGLRGERREQLFSSESELILGMSSSVCALCGVALHLKASSEKPKQFVVDRERNGDYISSGQLDDIFLKIVENSSGFSFAGSVLNYVLPEKNNSTDKCMKREDRISSKTQSTESSKLKSKLLFIQQISSDRSSPTPKYLIMKREYMTSSHQCVVDMSSTVSSMQDDASTLIQDVFCPCACGLFVKDGTETEVSINSVYIPKDKLIKTYYINYNKYNIQ